MSWANVLHFYQPHEQKRDIIDAITAQCYRPIAEAILANKGARLTINLTGVLLDQLDQWGYRDVIEMYAEAVRRGQVELVGSAKFHTILPLLPASEALRQLEINNETGRKYFGDLWKPTGVFLPEMAYSPDLAKVIQQAGFKWVVLDELAYNGRVGQVDYSKTYKIEGTSLKAVFREHRLSTTIMSAAPREIARLRDAAREELAKDRYILTGMDGETFGHHRVGHEQLLFSMFREPELGLVTVSEVLERFTDVETIKSIACTWASSEGDIVEGVQFISWRDPKNEIHALQWEMLELGVSELSRMPKSHPEFERLRQKLDVAVSSDQFYWAAAKPWWMIEFIERGAYTLLDILQQIPEANRDLSGRALDLYHAIMGLAFDWQRSGKIDDEEHGKKANLVRVPFKERTLEAGDVATWNAFIDMIRKQESEAASRGDYEEAILWRDSLYKLEHKLDIYDYLYVIDLLRMRLPQGEIEETIKRYKAKFDHIRGGQVEQRSN
jgi:hypothetical protein